MKENAARQIGKMIELHGRKYEVETALGDLFKNLNNIEDPVMKGVLTDIAIIQEAILDHIGYLKKK